MGRLSKIKRELIEDANKRLLGEGPHCGELTGEPCSGTGCGDGATWQDISLGSGWCQCQNTNGSHCGSVIQAGGTTKTGQVVQNTGMGDSAISSLRHAGLNE